MGEEALFPQTGNLSEDLLSVSEGKPQMRAARNLSEGPACFAQNVVTSDRNPVTDGRDFRLSTTLCTEEESPIPNESQLRSLPMANSHWQPHFPPS